MPVQTVPDTHPAYYTSGTRSFLGVKQPGHGADHASHSRAKVVNGLELYLCLPSVPAQVCHGVTFTLACPSLHVFWVIVVHVFDFQQICYYTILLILVGSLSCTSHTSAVLISSAYYLYRSNFVPKWLVLCFITYCCGQLHNSQST